MGLRNIYFCDICERDINKGDVFYGNYSYECKNGETTHDLKPLKITLCEECFSKFLQKIEAKDLDFVDEYENLTGDELADLINTQLQSEQEKKEA